MNTLNPKAKRLALGSSTQVLTLLAQIAVIFFLLPFMVHTLGDRLYGMWALLGSIVGYYALMNFGLTPATQRFIAQAVARDAREDARSAFASAICLFAGISAIALTVTPLLALLSGSFVDDPADREIFVTAILILGADMAIAFPFFAVIGAIEAHTRFDLLSYLELIKLVLRTILIVFVLSQEYAVVGLAIAVLVSNLIGHVGTVLLLRRVCPWLGFRPAAVRRATMKRLFQFSYVSFLITIGDQIRFRSDNLIIAAMLSLSVVTHYAIAARLIEYFRVMMSKGLASVMGPVFAQYDALKDYENLREKFLLVVRLSIIATSVIGGGLLIFGEAFISLWMGPEYADSYQALAVLLIGTMAAMAQAPSSSLLYAMARHRYYAGMNFGEAGAKVALSITLAGPLGIVGVALGTTIPMLITKLWFQPRYVCRQIEMPLGHYYGQALRVFLPAVLVQVPIGYVVQRQTFDSLLPLFALAVAIYAPLSLLLFRFALPLSDRKFVLSAVPLPLWLRTPLLAERKP